MCVRGGGALIIMHGRGRMTIDVVREVYSIGVMYSISCMAVVVRP